MWALYTIPVVIVLASIVVNAVRERRRRRSDETVARPAPPTGPERAG
jgi:hypothetical protein